MRSRARLLATVLVCSALFAATSAPAASAPATARSSGDLTARSIPRPASAVSTPATGAPALSISLVTSPATGQDFSFAGCQVGGGCTPFALDDDADPALPSSISADVLPAGTYTVTQATVAGWSLSDLVCSTGATVDVAQRRATITLDGSTSVSCAFTDTSASITIAMSVSPASSQAFTYTGCQGSGCTDFALDGRGGDPTLPTSITAAVAPGTYTVTQATQANWYLNAISCTSEAVDLANRRVTIVVDPGEQVRCRFDTVGRRITIEEASDPADPQDFTYTGCRTPGGCGTFTLDDDTDPTLSDTFVASDLPDGTYVITQGSVPNWKISSLTCTAGGTATAADRKVTIDMPPGRGLLVDCRFANRTTSLTIVEDAVPDSPQDFAFTGCMGSACAPFALDDDHDPTLARSLTATALAPGTYTVTQAPVPDLPLRSLSCTNGEVVDLSQRRATVTLTANERVFCFFKNGQRGITVQQDTEPDGPQDFTLQTCHLGTGCGTATLDDDADPTVPSSVTASGIPAGTYAIHQALTPGYSRPETSCGSVDPESAAPFADGITVTYRSTDIVTCTFRNIPAGPPISGSPSVSAASSRACAVTGTGGVRCWGGPGGGAVNPGDEAALAQTVLDDSGAPLSGIADVEVGGGFACALGTDGRVRCWGANAHGQLGDGSHDDREQPTPLSDPNGVALVGATQITTSAHTCAVLRNRQARCWGRNDHGQLGDGTTTDASRPVVVVAPDGSGPLTGVVQISAYGAQTCAVRDDGGVLCWGQGALGNGGTPGSGQAVRPVVVSDPTGSGPLTGALAVASGGRSTACALLGSGQVLCWGKNAHGELGDGTTTDRPRPVPVLDVTGTAPLSGVAGVTAGASHTCAWLVNGEARCWGTGGSGELGNNSTPTTATSRPVVVTNGDGTAPLGDVTSMSAGDQFTCATERDGPLLCWGQNFYWTLGTGSSQLWSTPVQVLTSP